MMASPGYQDPEFYFSAFIPNYQASTSWPNVAARAPVITSHLHFSQLERGSDKKDNLPSPEEASWKLHISLAETWSPDHRSRKMQICS